MRRLPILSLILLPAVSHAADFDGATLSLFWGAPFALILLSIALGPLFFAHTWHHHFGKITAFWTLLFLVPFAVVFGFGAGVHTVAHALVEEYIPFILLLLALYTISGGILVWGKLNGTPALNTGLLAAGTVMASFMGTTGAAMLMIRPLLKANQGACRYILYFFGGKYRRRPDAVGRSSAVFRLLEGRGFHVDGETHVDARIDQYGGAVAGVLYYRQPLLRA